jgi:Mg2+-importing ATPase
MNTTMRPRRRTFTVGRAPGPDDTLLDDAGAATAAELLQLAACPPREALRRLGSGESGLSEAEVVARLTEHGINQLPSGGAPAWWASVRSPFLVLLAALDAVVALTGDFLGVALITAMLAVSVGLRLYQARRFDHLLAGLRNLAAPRVTVLRHPGRGPWGRPVARTRNARLLAPGDLVVLRTGDVVPADCRIVTSDGLALDQATFTGESMPVAKYATHPRAREPGWLEQPAPARPGSGAGVLGAPVLCLTGTTVAAGSATAVVAKTGKNTILAATTRKITQPRSPTSADLGLRGVTWLLIRLIGVLVPAVFILTAITHRGGDWASAGLFAVAVAVGLVPEMLPVILAAAHGRGLSALARQRVIVTRPTAVQDLAGMDVLCTDKTGTLTAGRPQLARWLAPDGTESAAVLDYALLSAAFTGGGRTLLDAAILGAAQPLDHDVARAQYDKAGEIGFDFTRRRASVILDPGTGPCLVVTKGAVTAVLSACTTVLLRGGEQPLTGVVCAQAEQVAQGLWNDGLRLVAVAYRSIGEEPGAGSGTGWETGLTLAGFLGFTDPPKPAAAQAIQHLAGQGVRTVILTGDTAGATIALCQATGIPPGVPVTGADTARLSDDALAALAEHTTVFAEVSPVDKARIVRALRTGGHVVGYLGDGINDTPALRAADIGLAVPEAAGVARQAADAILLSKDLDILHGGITAARHATLNATKYLKATVSANLGNVLSILAASAFLPFLPMLPLQILVQNLGYDLAQLTLPLDHADPGQLTRPHRWSTRDLTIFITCFAPLSSAFDLITFQLLQHTHTGITSHQMLFHAGWFTESLLTQILAVLIIRTERFPLLQSRPAAAVGPRLPRRLRPGHSPALHARRNLARASATTPRHPHPPAPHRRHLSHRPASRQDHLPPHHRPLAVTAPATEPPTALPPLKEPGSK